MLEDFQLQLEGQCGHGRAGQFREQVEILLAPRMCDNGRRVTMGGYAHPRPSCFPAHRATAHGPARAPCDRCVLCVGGA